MFNKDKAVADKAREHVKGVIIDVVNEVIEEKLKDIDARLCELER